jgi:hypothetical protein
VLAIIASSWFYDEVIRHSPPGILVTYRPARVTVKETTTVAWISVPDDLNPPSHVTVAPVELAGPVPRQLPAHIPHFVGRAGVHSPGAGNWSQLMAGNGGSQGLPSSALRMASSAVMPWAAVSR